MNRTEKAEFVNRLAERLTKSPNLYLTDFTGIAVKPVTELRRKLRSAGVDCMVVKNTLALRALEQASVEGLNDLLEGPTAFVFAGADPLSAAKVLTDFQTEHQQLTVKAGLLDGQRVDASYIKRIASLPPRDQLLSQAGGALQAPLQAFVGALSGLLNQMVGVLEALRSERAAS